MGGSCPPPQCITGTMLRTLANIRVVLVAVLLLGTACAARKCGICGKEGHNRATCPQRPGAVAVLPSPLPGMRPPHAGSPAPDPVAPPTVLPAAPGARAPRKCSHCHQPGHNVATCQQAAAQRTAAAATAATAVAALTAATGVARRPRARLGWRPWPVRHRPGGCAIRPLWRMLPFTFIRRILCTFMHFCNSCWHSRPTVLAPCCSPWCRMVGWLHGMHATRCDACDGRTMRERAHAEGPGGLPDVAGVVVVTVV